MKQSTKEFISNIMSINIDQVKRRLEREDISYFSQAINDYMDEVSEKFVEHVDIETLKLFISERFSQYSKLFPEHAAYDVLDSIRHAFNSFATGGLKDLCFYQSNEGWYPKLNIRELIDTTELETYPDDLVIYRGCDVSELQNCIFGQSWTIDERVAQEFAYDHYKSQPWFVASNRCVLKAILPKRSVYLTRLWHREKEVVIDTLALSVVSTCT